MFANMTQFKALMGTRLYYKRPASYISLGIPKRLSKIDGSDGVYCYIQTATDSAFSKVLGPPEMCQILQKGYQT